MKHTLGPFVKDSWQDPCSDCKSLSWPLERTGTWRQKQSLPEVDIWNSLLLPSPSKILFSHYNGSPGQVTQMETPEMWLLPALSIQALNVYTIYRPHLFIIKRQSHRLPGIWELGRRDVLVFQILRMGRIQEKSSFRLTSHSSLVLYICGSQNISQSKSILLFLLYFSTAV